MQNTTLRLVLVLPTSTSITIGNQVDEPGQISVNKPDKVVPKN